MCGTGLGTSSWQLAFLRSAERGRKSGSGDIGTDLTKDLSFSNKGFSGMFLERFLDKVPLVLRFISAACCRAEEEVSGDCWSVSAAGVAGGIVSSSVAAEVGGTVSISRVLRST